jgi:hypothetical protein
MNGKTKLTAPKSTVSPIHTTQVASQLNSVNLVFRPQVFLCLRDKEIFQHYSDIRRFSRSRYQQGESDSEEPDSSDEDDTFKPAIAMDQFERFFDCLRGFYQVVRLFALFLT